MADRLISFPKLLVITFTLAHASQAVSRHRSGNRSLVQVEPTGSFIRAQQDRPHRSDSQKNSLAESRSKHRFSDVNISSFWGCNKLFFDIGSNVGTHVRRVFEPELYPESPYLKLLTEGFGEADKRRTDKSLCAFGIEANPRWEHRLESIESAYNEMGWRAKWLVPRAASNVDGHSISLKGNGMDGAHNDWGASIVPGIPGEIQIQTLDVGSFVKRGIEAARGQVGKPEHAYTLIKMDIEGAEYIVLPSMLEAGVLCKFYIDKLTIEWHNSTLDEEGLQNAAKLETALADPSRCPHDQPTEIVSMDDESYLLDGAALPTMNDLCYASNGAYTWICGIFTWPRVRYKDEASRDKFDRGVMYLFNGLGALAGIAVCYVLYADQRRGKLDR
eukprot:TRINITY_DN78682_c0_g1_i1.p1 TRINITY_DN78682_c0_g1~~TRINITY_DN78682_c0_g1_i1.p1  ORF type:complete len:388 (-),score=56.69 TRINITY_DN78682_c0_g1_i1:23-1186(-)